MGGDYIELIENVAFKINTEGYQCKILAASFHALSQVEDALNADTQSVTVPYSILETIFKNPNIDKAVTDFNNDWFGVYNEDILNLK